MKGRSYLHRFKEWFLILAIPLIFISTGRSAIADWNDVPTGSMKPTILEGDRIFVNKLAYSLRVPFTQRILARWSEPERGDIVVCFSPADGTRLVKRIVAIPGDTIAMRNNCLYINGQPASYQPMESEPFEDGLTGDEIYSFYSEDVDGREHVVMTMPHRRSLSTFQPLQLGEEEYFMMGDNRDNSGDSRHWGPMPRKLIVGKVSRVVFSLDREHHFKPRTDRFFRELI